MSLQYPTPTKYKVQQSQIRYQYKNTDKIKQLTFKYLFAYKNLDRYHNVKSDILIDSLYYFVNIIKRWDKKSKEINGWTSAFLTIRILNNILNGLKRKFSYYSKEIKFSNVEAIYQTIDCENKKIIPINNLIFGILIAVEEHQNEIQFIELLKILEMMAQNQLIYLIANYQSRRTRSYQFPWERIDDPVIDYRKKYLRQRDNNRRERKIRLDKRQLKIKHFFNNTSLNEEDLEILKILDDLEK